MINGHFKHPMDKFIIELHGHKIIVILNVNKYDIDLLWCVRSVRWSTNIVITHPTSLLSLSLSASSKQNILHLPLARPALFGDVIRAGGGRAGWQRILWFIMKGWSVFCIWTDPLKWRWRGTRNTLIPRTDINSPRSPDTTNILSVYISISAIIPGQSTAPESNMCVNWHPPLFTSICLFEGTGIYEMRSFI